MAIKSAPADRAIVESLGIELSDVLNIRKRLFWFEARR